MRALALLALGLLLGGCGPGGSGQTAGDEGKRLALEGLSLSVPVGWSSYAVDFGPWTSEPMLWVANVHLPREPSKDHLDELPPYQVLSGLPPTGIVLLVHAVHAEASAEEECPSARLRLTAVDVDGPGKPAPNVASGEVYSHSQGLCLYAQAWFGVNEPDEAMRAQVNRILASVELEPEPTPGSDAGWKTYRDEKARVTLRYPPDWKVADTPVLPLLVEPRELVTLSTFAVHSDESCPQAPEAAVEALGSGDALIVLLEYRSDAHAPPRPERMLPYHGDRPPTCRRLQLPHGLLFRAQTFEDRGRVFHLYLAVGESASDQTRRQVTEILNAMSFD